jgi:PAP2 superfamily
MKKYNCMALILFFIWNSNAQIQDSVKTPHDIIKVKFNYNKLILPASLIVAGGILKSPEIQNNLQKNIRNFFGQDFHTKTDNYLQFVPAVQLLAGRSLGFESKAGYKQMLANLLISNLMVETVVSLTKNTTHDLRPDGSATNSFPSGHTATAFNNATLLFLAYKNSNVWYAASGYLFATTTGVFRIANNRHWPGDVLAGAGIGIAVGTIVNYWNPFHFDDKNKNTSFIAYPVVNDKSYGLGMLYQIK